MNDELQTQNKKHEMMSFTTANREEENHRLHRLHRFREDLGLAQGYWRPTQRFHRRENKEGETKIKRFRRLSKGPRKDDILSGWKGLGCLVPNPSLF
jgi:hypothetical protein